MKPTPFLLLIILAFHSCNPKERQPEKPNILFCILDDASYPHAGAYGCNWIKTPGIDRIAGEGILFTNAYTPNAKCAPSRSGILTGRNSWQLEEAANHIVNFPAKFKTFPEVLREHGYCTGLTGKGWAPGNPGMVDGKERLLIGDLFDEIKTKSPTSGISNKDYAKNFEAFLDGQPECQPWFFWYGAHEPHRRYEYGTGHALGGKSTGSIDSVPAFWPDNGITRNDMLDYAYEIEYADSHLLRMIQLLEDRGELDNTLILITSDNGMPFPRCKAQEYEFSNHMPLAIMWKKGIVNPGREVSDMVSFIDFAPTFLELAGIPFDQSGMHESPGRSLTDILFSEKSGQVNPERDYLLIGKERHDYSRPNNQGFPIRGIVTDDYLFLINYNIDLWPAGNPELGYLDCDGSPTKTEILNLHRSGTDDSYWQWSFGKRTTIEEMYNISEDNECMNNLAGDEQFADLKLKLKTIMEEDLKAQEDPRMFGNGDIFNTYGYSDPDAWNFYERFMAGEFTPAKTNWVNPSDYEGQEKR